MSQLFVVVVFNHLFIIKAEKATSIVWKLLKIKNASKDRTYHINIEIVYKRKQAQTSPDKHFFVNFNY